MNVRTVSFVYQMSEKERRIKENDEYEFKKRINGFGDFWGHQRPLVLFVVKQ